MSNPEEFNDLMTVSGVALASLGVKDIGLLRTDALRAIEILRQGNRPILGGDVYLRRGNRLEIAYANWHADPEPNEDREAYLFRSWDKAEAFIKSFLETPDAETLFAIVVEKAPEAGTR